MLLLFTYIMFKIAKNAGVPENFFDSAKTKAFLNLNKAPQKSILKNSGGAQVGQAVNSPAANSKAKGSEWTSRFCSKPFKSVVEY